MAAPPIPPIDHLADRTFSFFPPIVGIEHNEWLLRKVTWSEVLVANTGSHQELWIPRRYLGEVSRIEDPVLIVGLSRELQYKGGMLSPFHRRLLELPVAPRSVGAASSITDDGAAQPAMGIRLEASDRRALKLIGIAVGFAILLYLLAVNYTRIGNIRQQTAFTMKDQSFLELSSHDDHFAVLAKLGKPGSIHNREIGTIQYEAIGYPDRKDTVILMGRDAKDLAYSGTVDERWHPVHYVSLRSGGSTDALLRSIEQF